MGGSVAGYLTSNIGRVKDFSIWYLTILCASLLERPKSRIMRTAMQGGRANSLQNFDVSGPGVPVAGICRKHEQL